MQPHVIQKSARRSVPAFWLGTLAVVSGVGLHLPMFIEAGRTMHYHMAGMPMDVPMLLGMFLILGGTLAVAYGLLAPRTVTNVDPAALLARAGAAHGREGGMSASHWRLAVVLTIAIVVDVMKPATLGFVLPGLAHEYRISRSWAALLPFVALTGTTVGSLVWGHLGDYMGRRAAILLSAIIFIATSICGAMPSFGWNLAMCFLMGASAGGMLPIAYTLLAEIAPAKHRGWYVVLPGALGMAGGFLVASLSATLLEPHFGWRILWFLGLPTGLIVILLNRFIPESPRFLLLHGRVQEAIEIMRRFGAAEVTSSPERSSARAPARTLLRAPYAGATLTLNLTAVVWGLVNFGFLLWLPSDLRARGYSAATADGLIALSSLIALPTAFLTAWLYNRWSTRNTLVLTCAITTLALGGLALVDRGWPLIDASLVLLIALLMFGCSGIIAMLLPYGAENYPLQIRGRGTGLVAGSSKLGGIAAQVFGLLGFVPPLATAASVLAVPIAVCGVLVARYGAETRGRRLEEIDARHAGVAGKGQVASEPV